MQQSVRNVCPKFKVDSFSRFRTGAYQVFNTQKFFPSEISLTMKIANTNSLETHFLIKLPSVKFLLKSLTSNKSILEQKSKYLFNSIRVFPFFHFIFLLKWNKQEIFKRRHEKDQKQSPQPATLLKKRLCHRCFPVNSAKFLRTPFLTEHLQWLLLKDGKLWSG